MTSQYEAWLDESGAHEWGPGGQPSASTQLDIQNRNNSGSKGRGKWKDNIMKALDLASDWKGQSKSSPGGNEKNYDDEYKQPGMAGGGFSDLGGGNTVQQGFVNQPFTLTTPGKRSMWGRIAGTTVGFIAGGPAGAYKGYQVGNQFDA